MAEKHVLTLRCAIGPVVERIVIEGDEPGDLEPRLIERGGYRWERYGDEQSYTDIRLDLIVARDRMTVHDRRPPEDDKPIAAEGTERIE